MPDTKKHADFQHERFSGFSLATKLTLIVGATLGFLMFTLGYLAHSRSRDAIEQELDAFGANMARALALADPETWDTTRDTVAAAARRLIGLSDEYGDYLKVMYGIQIDPDARPVRTGGKRQVRGLTREVQEQQEKILQQFKESTSKNERLWSQLLRYGPEDGGVPSEILDAFLIDVASRHAIIRAAPRARGFQSTGAAREYVVKAGNGLRITGVEIRDGEMEEAGPARSYMYPVRGPDGEIAYQSYVFLSRRRMEELPRQLQRRLLLYSAAFSALGIVACYLVARRMTRPILQLVHDVDTVTAGDLHHRSSVRSSDEIGLLARTMDIMVRRLDEARGVPTTQLADDLHRRQVPEAVPYISGFFVDVLHKLTDQIGATYYDFVDFPGKCRGLVLAQGSKRGLAAAMNVIMAGTLVRAEALETGDPAEILRRINRTLYENIHAEMHVDLLLAILDRERSELKLCCAGDLPCIVFHNSSGRAERVELPGLPLGQDPGPRFDGSLEVRTIALQPYDRLVVTNGGVACLHGADQQALGMQRWVDLIGELARVAATSFVPRLQERLADLLGESAIDHDVVVVTLVKEDPRAS